MQRTQDKLWASDMSNEQIIERLKVLEVCLEGRSRRGLKSMLKRQRQELLDEIERRNNG